MKRRFLSKALTILMGTLLLFSILPTPSVQAAQVTVTTTLTDYYYNPNAATNLPAPFAAYNANGGRASVHWIGGEGGTPVYDLYISNPETASGSNYDESETPNIALTQEQKNYINVILGNDGAYYNGVLLSDRIYQIATQIAIWLITTGCYTDPTAVNAVCADFVPVRSIGGNIKSILQNCVDAYARPSFSVDIADTKPVYQMTYDETTGISRVLLTDRYNVTINHLNGIVVSWGFENITKPNFTITRSNNTIIITGTPEEVEHFVVYRDPQLKHAQLKYLNKGTNQTIVYNGGTYYDSVAACFDVKPAAGGNLQLTNTAEDGVIDGMQYRITCAANSYDNTVTTDVSGGITLNALSAGMYTITEVSTPERYLQPASQTAEIKDGRRTTAVTFANVLKKGKISTYLRSSSNNTPLSGAKYGIYKAANDELVGEVISDNAGHIESSLLPYGDYYLKEITPPANHELDTEEYPFSIRTEGENVTVELNKNIKVENEPDVNIPAEGTANVKTGDYSNILLYIGIGAAALIGLIVLILFRKKEKKMI